MPWVKIDDDMCEHPKLVSVGPLGIALQVAALCYSNAHLTDGFIQFNVVHQLLSWKFSPPGETKVCAIGITSGMWGDDITSDMVAGWLVKAGVWELVEGGYYIHDYPEYQPSRAQVLAQRDIAARRKAMNANPDIVHTVRERDKTCRYCGKSVNWKDRRGPDGGTYDHVIPLSDGGDESPENIVVCCRACNMHKGARSPDEAEMPLLPLMESNRNQDGIKTESRRNLDGIKTESRHPVPVPVPVPVPTPDPQGGNGASAPDANASAPPTIPEPVMVKLKPKQKRITSDVRAQTPAIQCARAINGARYPPRELFDDIIRILGPTPDGPKLAECRKEWVARGYNRNSWKWLTEWYVGGIPERARGPGGYETVFEKSQQAIKEYLEEARVKHGEPRDDSGDFFTVDGTVAKGSGHEANLESL